MRCTSYFHYSNVLLEAFKVGDYDYRREYNAKRWQNNYNFDSSSRKDVILKEMKNDRPSGMNALVFNTRKKLFKNPKVREAISYAYDFGAAPDVLRACPNDGCQTTKKFKISHV